ncbi:6-bladed beta-propeller [Sphingobacterium mizutaii]|uniref:6-bladed beta-propeller n=1 Tax=Sphingobacterium mizutaii TaxID=1010 RepID=UPI0028990EAB|nr:6-bladed beta-propeller [Sphingobacterium mizutaii]
MNKYILTFLFLAIVSYCRSQVGIIDSSEVKVIRIDPRQAFGKRVSEVFDHVQYTPLETTKESSFGEISKLEFSENRLVIFDMDTWAIYIFDRSGKFINKISEKQIGSLANSTQQNTRSAFNTFTVRKYNGKDVINVSLPNSIIRFDMDGQYLSKIEMKNNIDYGYVLTQGKKVLNGYLDAAKNYYEFAVIGNKGDTTLYFPFDIMSYDIDDLISGNRISYGKDFLNLLYSNYYSYDIFEINSTKVSYKYKLILPGDISLPKDFITNKEYNQKRLPYLMKNKAVVYGLSNMHAIGNYLYIKFDSYNHLKTSRKNIAYHLKTNIPISLQDLTPDKLSYYLPIEDSSCGSNFMSTGFIGFDGKNLYTSISSHCMKTFMHQNEQKDVSYPKELNNMLGAKLHDQNPILVILTPKAD